MSHYSPLISAFVTLLLTLILTLNKEGLLQDIPNDRSLHTEPKPRTGGIALMAGILSGWMLMIQFWAWWVVLPALGLFVLSLVDDMRSLTARTRLIGHFVAAMIVLGGAGVELFWMLPVLLFIVWMTNLYNFMDGSDGLAGGMALFGFSFYGIAGLMHNDETFAMMNFSVGAAALGFLYHNFNPAKVFMGDAGSIPLGFLAAAFGVWGWQQGYWPFWFPALVFSPFVADATLTLLKRLLRREQLSQAHRSHYYQRLHRLGAGHRGTLAVYGCWMAGSGLTALACLAWERSLGWPAFCAWCVAGAALFAAIDYHWRTRPDSMQ